MKNIHKTGWSGIWDSDLLGNIYYTKIDDQVFLDLPRIASFASRVNKITSTVNLPNELRPSIDMIYMISIMNNRIAYPAPLVISTDGSIMIWGSSNYENFRGEGISGFFPTGIRYFLGDENE